MSQHSAIEWTEATWNVVAGCSRVSPGCDHCYAIRDAHRMGANPNPKVAAAYGGLTLRSTSGGLDWLGTVRLLPDRLGIPLSNKKPTVYFLNSMSNLLHPGVSKAAIQAIFAVMRE